MSDSINAPPSGPGAPSVASTSRVEEKKEDMSHITELEFTADDLRELGVSGDAESETYCKLCGCEKVQAWPRVVNPDPTWWSSCRFTGKQLLEAICYGCRACLLLKRGIEHFQTLQHVELESDNEYASEYHVNYRQEDEGWIVYLPETDPRVLLEFTQSLENGIPEASVEVKSSSALLWVERQLEHCRLNHTRCVTTSFSTYNKPLSSRSVHWENQAISTLPTRLLDLGRSNSDIRLWETPINARGKYACLSHCWGKQKLIQTKKDNLEAFKTGISWSSIPKTFQDAINFTRNLNLQFLWIDSLCIVQDDQDDWNKEAAKMASIYRDSWIMLAATGSKDSQGGLFFDRNPRKTGVFKRSARNGVGCEVMVRPRIRHYDDKYDVRDIRYQFESLFPLLKRAWAFQERLIAPRVVHFCQEDIMWECMEQCCCYCGNFSPRDFHPKLTHANSSSATAIGWRRLVEEYSKHDLTYEEDRLPALAGLSDQTGRGRYLAGLWEDSLVGDLCWKRLDSATVKAKDVEFSSPTWSWSALGGQPIYYPYFPLESGIVQLCEIMEINYTPLAKSNPRGQVNNAKLVIRGHVIETTLKDGRIDLPGANKGLFTLDYDVTPPGPNHVEEGSALYCLTICAMGNYIYALILKCIDAEAQIYKRIGLLQCLPYWGFDEVDLLVNFSPEARLSAEEDFGEDVKQVCCITLRYVLDKSKRKHNLDTVLQSIKPDSTPQFRSESGWMLIKLTPEQAAIVKSHPLVRKVYKKTCTPLNDPKEGKWFRVPEEAEMKAQGYNFKEIYLGKIVNII